MGITRANYGIIYIQNIILNNIDVFDKLLADAVIKYKPIKDEEIKQKIKEIEQWNENWKLRKVEIIIPILINHLNLPCHCIRDLLKIRPI